MLVQSNPGSQKEWNTNSFNHIPTPYPESRHSRRVLLVDDDEVVRECLSALLEREHFDVEVAASGDEALHIMKIFEYDILITDWQMPDMDGLALCRRVRREYGDDDLYVMLLTVRDTKEDRLAGIAAGADDYVVKGGPIHEVLKRLNKGHTPASRSFGRHNPENPLSLIDPLTNVHNLRFFTGQLPREIERARRNRHALAVLCCRIEEFARTTQRFGHEVGDDALRALVADSNSCIRKQPGWIARVAVDQFMVVLPQTRFKDADRIARKLSHIFAAVPVNTTLFGPIRFLVRIAVTACEPKHGSNNFPPTEELLRSTDDPFLH